MIGNTKWMLEMKSRHRIIERKHKEDVGNEELMRKWWEGTLG